MGGKSGTGNSKKDGGDRASLPSQVDPASILRPVQVGASSAVAGSSAVDGGAEDSVDELSGDDGFDVEALEQEKAELADLKAWVAEAGASTSGPTGR